MKTEKLSEQIITRNLKKLGLGISGTIEDKAKRLYRHFELRNKAGDDIIVHCGTCDGYSVGEFAECPYCGDNSPIDEAIVDDDVEVDEIDSLLSKDSDENSITIEPKEYGLLDLEIAVSKIKNAGRMAAEQLYTIGKTLNFIRAEQLWRLRLTESGGPIYTSFFDFCDEEVGFNQQHAKKIMAICDVFSKEQILDFGIHRLSFAVRFPDKAERDEFLNRAKELPAKESSRLAQRLAAGQSIDKNDPVEKIHDARREAGDTTPVLPPITPPQQPAINKLAPETVMVELPIGQYDVEMWKRPKDLILHTRSNQKTEPAYSLDDDPWIRLDLSQSIYMTMKISREINGSLVAIVDVRRTPEEQ